MFEKPQSEHQWLDTFIGEWSYTSDCIMGPDQEPVKSEGHVVVRSLGGLWILFEGEGTAPDGDTWSSITTIGYDPAQKKYVGTFIASMMTFLWTYHGSIQEERKLVLDTEGPRFDQQGTANYQDIFEIIDNDHWLLSSQILDDNGQWQQFMTAHHHRKK